VEFDKTHGPFGVAREGRKPGGEDKDGGPSGRQRVGEGVAGTGAQRENGPELPRRLKTLFLASGHSEG
jgi:hypothetical protein